MAKEKNTIKDVILCDGVKLSKSIYETKENRLLTLLVKGFVVYLLSMGSIGFYLSALSIEYNALICHVVIFVMALASAMLYYRLLVENLGYLIVLLIFCILVYRFRTYINSGFYAIVNITTDGAAQFFNIDIQRVYAEQIENRYVTVTFAVLFIGIVLDIFLNVYISRRMQYVTAIFSIMGLNMVPLYLIFEPDGFYAAMLLGGMALAYVYKSGRHYSPQVSVKRDDIKYKPMGKKKNGPREISYVYDVKAMVNAGVIALAFIIVMVTVISAFKPKDSFNVGYEGNKYKKLSMAAVSTILMDGLSGFYKMSEDVGGLESGKLGQVSTIRLDYQTDLVIELTPYTNERMYFKGFTGVQYNPYANSWTSIDNISGVVDYYESPEAKSLRQSYKEGYKYSSETKIRINNVTDDKIYRPYYCYSLEYNRQFMEFLTYPRLEKNKAHMDFELYEQEMYTDADLYVPEENIEAVEEIVRELGDPLTNEQIVQSLIDYYQENFPYTIQPGKTPYRQDFVNDFLLEKKKGYCSHYASAAVLIYRYLGLPARYVEGYAVDLEQIYNGEIVNGERYQDYYSGYSELGETALVSVNVTDADAHAWVEVFDYKYGWVPVEVTPYAINQEEDAEDFWSMFADMMDDSQNLGDEAVNMAFGENGAVNEIIKNAVYFVGCVIGLVALIILCIKLKDIVLFWTIMSKANYNDKLIFMYQRRSTKLRKRDKKFKELINHREQIEYIILKKQEKIQAQGALENRCNDQDAIKKSQEKVIAILEKAGFSQEVISQDDYTYVVNWCRQNL